jgi:hypothetical protein
MPSLVHRVWSDLVYEVAGRWRAFRAPKLPLTTRELERWLWKEFTSSEDPEERRSAALGLRNVALEHEVNGSLDAAISTEERLLSALAGAEPGLDEAIATTLHNLANHQEQSGQLLAAIATGERLRDGFLDANDDSVRVAVASGLCLLQFRQRKAALLDAAIKTGKQQWETFGDDRNLDVREHCAKGLQQLARSQAAAGQTFAAIATDELLWERFGDSGLDIAEAWAALGLCDLATYQLQAGNPAKAVETCDRIIGVAPALQGQLDRLATRREREGKAQTARYLREIIDMFEPCRRFVMGLLDDDHPTSRSLPH